MPLACLLSERRRYVHWKVYNFKVKLNCCTSFFPCLPPPLSGYDTDQYSIYKKVAIDEKEANAQEYQYL